MPGNGDSDRLGVGGHTVASPQSAAGDVAGAGHDHDDGTTDDFAIDGGKSRRGAQLHGARLGRELDEPVFRTDEKRRRRWRCRRGIRRRHDVDAGTGPSAAIEAGGSALSSRAPQQLAQGGDEAKQGTSPTCMSHAHDDTACSPPSLPSSSVPLSTEAIDNCRAST